MKPKLKRRFSDRMRSVFYVPIEIASKYLVCSWLHREHHCHPTVWGPEQAKEMGIPYRPNAWHCRECHPCGEGFDRLIKGKIFKEEEFKQP
jgi:hypothetical protein